MAWEFVKFCADNPLISPENKTPYYPYTYSVNRKGFTNTWEKWMESTYKTNAAYGYYPKIAAIEDVDAVLQQITGIMERCGQSIEDAGLYNSTFYFVPALDDYRAQKISLDELVACVVDTVRNSEE